MKRYEKYKDSGVEWLGEIPEHWSLRNFEIVAKKDRYSITGGPFGSDLKNQEYTEKGVRIIQLQNIGVGEFRNDYKIYTSEEKANQLFSSNIFPGEIIIAKMADPVARACIIPDFDKRYVMASDGIRLEVDTDQFNVKFIEYSINSKYFNFQAELNSTGTTRSRIGLSTLKKLKIILPSLAEQTQIAFFINHKVSIINQLITEKESLIAKLQEKRKALINEVVTKGLNPNAPMLDSGIEWLGMIPEHWKVTKINRAFNEIGSGTTPTSGSSKYYENGDINWLNTGDLNDGVITKTNKCITSVAIKEFSTLKLYPKGSVVIALYGATIGKLGLLEISTTTNQACCVLSASTSITQKYLFYYLYSSREHIISLAYGGGQPNISQELIKQLPILQTSIEEQSAIVDFIESRTTKIDETIGEIKFQLQKLKEYKTAVISEVVTGKVDVRDWKAMNN